MCEAAGREIEKRIRVCLDFGDFRKVNISAEQNHSIGFGRLDQIEQPLSLARKAAPFIHAFPAIAPPHVRSFAKLVLVNLAALHDELEIFLGLGDDLDVLQRIGTVNQHVGPGTFLDHAQRGGSVGITGLRHS